MMNIIPIINQYFLILQNFCIILIYRVFIYEVKGTEKCDLAEQFAICAFKESPEVST